MKVEIESGLMDGYEEHVENDLQIIFSGKKKSKKKNSHGLASARGEDDLRKNRYEVADPDNIGHDKNVGLNGDMKIEMEYGLMDGHGQHVEDDLQIIFSGKKKSKQKSSRGLTSTSGEDDLLKNHDGEAEYPDNISQNNNFDALEADAQNTAKVVEPSKNKKKKKKGGKTAQDDDLDKILEELGEGPSKSSFSALQEDVEQNVLFQSVSVNDEQEKEKEVGLESAAVKKKKKGGKAARDDDLDKILAELGEGPSKSTHAPLPEVVEQRVLESVSINDEEREKDVSIESAAAKKKKKKKEKEKEKKAAAAAASATASEGKEEGQRPIETKNEIKSKGGDKKLSKGGKGIQQLIAKRKEAEERQKREEEERLRKEEEERLRKEELERQAEEAKRKKKEREKEKLKMKKLEGKLLTDKQKEEARRLEAMRNQFLSNAGGLSLPNLGAGGAPAKRPIYQTKKSKASSALSNGNILAEASVSVEEATPLQKASHLSSLETEKIEESVSAGDAEPEACEVDEKDIEAEAESEDDDEDWDAKSWDDAVLTLPVKSAFADEDCDLKPELPKKEKEITKVPVTDWESSNSTAIKEIPPHPTHMKVSSREKSLSYELHEKSDGVEVDKCETVVPSTPDSSDENLRSPICCIMGHVDTGKTKLLDCIRGTNVQEGEAGGITQQIGATYFPAENIRERTKELKEDAKLKVPGLLVIDTPGHESFTNLRSRGSGLCDIAILVVDIMHGLEPQTVESINLLRMRSTEFIVALNKVDRLYGWKVCRNAPIMKALKQQSKEVKSEFERRLSEIIFQFKEQGLNTQLYYKNKDHGDTYNIVPTSAISGEGIPDLLLWLVQWTQKTMVEKLTFSNDVQCTVLEVKVIEGHGTTIDVVLVNGVLHEGDQIIVCGMQGPIVTTIRALLTPHPMKELRVKGTYLHHKEIKAAQGIKISAQGLEHAVAGTGLYVVSPGDDVEVVKEAAMEDMRSVMSRIDKSGEGVYVQASTIGSLEALLEFLKSPAVKIPVSGIGIGPVHKKDVMKASVMLEKKKEFATILAFDVKVTPEARELAEEQGVRIFCADIIYHLFDQFNAYIENLKEEKRREAADEAVFPCVLKIMPNCIFNKKDPIVLGVDVIEGIAKVGTPICIPQREFIDIGRISSIENNHKPVDVAPKGQKVAIKIVGSTPDEQQKMFGRHFEMEDMLVSRLTRKSIDVLKENYRNDLSKDEWQLVVKLKRLLNIT